MDNKFNQFKLNIERKLVDVKAEVKNLSDNVQALGKSIGGLGDEFGDFAAYVSEMYNEHEQIISALERTSKC